MESAEFVDYNEAGPGARSRLRKELTKNSLD